MDALVKSTFIPVSYFVATKTGQGTGVGVAAVIAAWIAFEHGYYQARYTLNDLVDRSVDERDARRSNPLHGRIPTNLTVRAAQAMIATRLVLLLATLAALSGLARWVLAAGTVAATFAAFIYEALRERTGRRTGTTSQALIHVLWWWVGTGYGIRMCIGVALAGAPAALFPLVFAAGVGFGSMFVRQTWTLEACGHVLSRSEGVLESKPHARQLLPKNPGARRPLLEPDAASRLAPAAIGAFAAAGVLGIVLSQSSRLWVVAAVMVCAMAFGHVARSVPRRAWAMTAGTVAVAIAAVASSSDSVLVRLIPIAVFAGTAAVFAVSGPALVGFPEHAEGDSL